MRKDIIITANSKTSRVDLPTSRLGLNGENLQGNIIVKFSDEFVNGNAILEIQRDDEKYYLTMQKENDLLTERVDIYKELNKQDEEKLTKTNSELEALAKKYGVTAEFDEYGNPTQKFADALWAAEQAAEKAAYDANYSAEEAYNAIDSDKKNKNKKQEAENDKIKAGENLENVKKDRETIAKLLKESSDLVYDIHGREIKIL